MAKLNREGKRQAATKANYLYVARVHRDKLTGQVSLTVGDDADVFEVAQGDEFITFVTPAPLLSHDRD